MDSIGQSDWLLYACSEGHRHDLLRIAEAEHLARQCRRTTWYDRMVGWLNGHRMMEEESRPIKTAVSRGT